MGRSCAHRQRFLEEIETLIPPGVIQFNKKLQTLEQHADRVQLFFADNPVEPVDVGAVLAL
jgi:hypothetical protein